MRLREREHDNQTREIYRWREKEESLQTNKTKTISVAFLEVNKMLLHEE